MKSVVGLSNFVIAPLNEDTSEGATYDAVQPVTGAVDVSVTPDNADPDIQYADDVEFDVLYPDPEITAAVELTALPLEIQEAIGGHKIDDNGVLVKTAGDTPPYYALGFKAERRDGADRYVWLLKGRAKPITEQFHTKEGSTITRQTGKVEFAFIKRTFDGQYQYSADVGKNGFTAEKAATFLSAVYEPTFTPAP
jgi:phi13 family phage major tail protein